MKYVHPRLITAFRATVIMLAIATTQTLASSGTQAFDEGMQPVLAGYLKIQQELAADSTDGVKAAAESIIQAASKLDAAHVSGEHAAHYKDVPDTLQEATEVLSKASDIDAAREAFKQLSKPMAMWGTMSKPDGVDVLFCPMAKASWLQKKGEVRNPYFGKTRLTCGEVVGGASHTMKEMKHQGRGGH